MLSSGAEVFERAFLDGLRPDPLLLVSEWADRHRRLSQKGSPEPGQWRTSRTPYLREIMDCLSPSSPVQEVVFKAGAQLGKTEGGCCWIGYIIDYAPGPAMMVQPTVDLAKRWSRQRFDPMVYETPRLSSKVADPKSRDSGNTMLSKEFPGGILIMTGANSAVGLRSMPVRYLFLDEIDGYPQDIDEEGDPVELAVARTRTFGRRKILKTSTPTIAGRSRIEASYQDSDQCHYHVPCPHCGELQWLKWRQLQWPKGEPEKAYYVCEHCGAVIEEHHKTWMMAEENGARWIADNPGHRGGKVRGFELSSLYSPLGWFSWGDAARQWVAAQGNATKLRVFVNTVLGETWKDRGEAPDWQRLYRRRRDYPRNVVQPGGLVLTAGVDVQKDRLEAEIVAWGRGLRSWSVDYRVFPGDTAGDEPWQQLARMLDEEWQHELGGTLRLGMLAVDAGYNTQRVFAWCRGQPVHRVVPVMGRSSVQAVVGQPRAADVRRSGRRVANGVKWWPVGTDVVKTELYGWLRQELDPENPEEIPDGYCEFPEYEPEYFKMLTAEQLVPRQARGGYLKYEWEKTRDRNEALDCRAYARAAAAIIGVDRYRDEEWDRLEAELVAAGPASAQQHAGPAVPKPRVMAAADPYL